jgi:hypothetical protein
MPDGYICLTRDAAKTALEAGDKVKTLESELKARDTANGVLQKALQDMTIEYAKASTEATMLKLEKVDWKLEREQLLKAVKRKCFLAICVGS